MPITFAPADPLDAQAAYGYGRAQRQQADRDFALRQQQVAQQAAAASYGTANQAAAIDNQAREAGDALRQRQQEFALSRQPSEADAYAVRAQQAAVQQRFELQAWLQDQELSQAEKVRYQRMQNAVGSVLTGDYSDDERKELLTQLRTGIDAGKQRLERAQARRQEEQANLEHQQVVLRAAHAQTNQDFRAEALKRGQGVTYFYDENTGKSHPLVWSEKDQKYYNPLTNSAKAAGKSEAQKDEFGRTPQDYQKAASDVEAKLDKWVADQKKIDPSFKLSPADYYQNFLGGMKLRGFKGSFEDHFAGKGTTGGGQPAPAPGQGGGGQGDAPPPVGGTPEAPEQRQRRVANLAASFFRGEQSFKARADLPPEKRAEYAAAAAKMRNLTVLYGSLSEMPEGPRKEAEKVMAFLSAVPDAPRPVQFGEFLAPGA